MAISLYMKITDKTITGSSTVKGNEGAFELISLSYGAAGIFTNHAGEGAGKASYSPITVTLNAFNGPQLIGALATGEHHTVTINTYKPNGQTGANTLLETITLQGAQFTLFQETSTSGADTALLELSIACEKFTYVQAGQNFTFTR